MTDRRGSLTGLDFTDRAWEKAEAYGHTAEMYAGIPPEGTRGEYLVSQVEAVEADRQAAAAAAPEATKPERAPSPAPPPPPRPDAQEPAVLEHSRWHGLKNYHCPRCSFKSLKEARVREHYRLRHLGLPQ